MSQTTLLRSSGTELEAFQASTLGVSIKQFRRNMIGRIRPSQQKEQARYTAKAQSRFRLSYLLIAGLILYGAIKYKTLFL